MKQSKVYVVIGVTDVKDMYFKQYNLKSLNLDFIIFIIISRKFVSKGLIEKYIIE